MRTIIFTALALIAFAGNSILCRLALGEQAIDPASFTAIRLLSGSVMLYVLIRFKKKVRQYKHEGLSQGSWLAALMLFVYAATFSYAYATLDTATGALILFGSIQVSMIAIALVRGDKLSLLEWAGLALAVFGFIYLMLPHASSPPWISFFLMMASGVAWSIYTVKGYGSLDPLYDTAYNFLKTIPFVIILLLFTFHSARYAWEGVLLAVLSGALASGVGYALWYLALRGLNVVQVAVLQLLVPIIAGAGGVVIVGEDLSMRLLISGVIILNGIGLVVWTRQRNG